MRKRHMDALTLKPGPTESGFYGGPRPEEPSPVGGELLQIDILPAFLSQYWFLILLLMFPLGVLLYKKRRTLFPWVLRLLTR